MKEIAQEAERIHTMFYRSFKLSNSEKDISWSDKHAKECALIYCDGILKAISMYTGSLNPTFKRYTEVRKLIEQLWNHR